MNVKFSQEAFKIWLFNVAVDIKCPHISKNIFQLWALAICESDTRRPPSWSRFQTAFFLRVSCHVKKWRRSRKAPAFPGFSEDFCKPPISQSVRLVECASFVGLPFPGAPFTSPNSSPLCGLLPICIRSGLCSWLRCRARSLLPPFTFLFLSLLLNSFCVYCAFLLVPCGICRFVL